eukprot:Gregarina_sp_Poly_1__4455@NODE_239_length_10907_cov_182_631458_g210_i0_p6_GENE_NODE_239_length_10907_cov_182_631458_g210_i0NODE_239_length_10907_cov_182_631458_g210_i0_p6_ORF_typecomplete_len237_score55_12_NODE_239_length_10907_cov_182_631458_g210_i0972710437
MRVFTLGFLVLGCLGDGDGMQRICRRLFYSQDAMESRINDWKAFEDAPGLDDLVRRLSEVKEYSRRPALRRRLLGSALMEFVESILDGDWDNIPGVEETDSNFLNDLVGHVQQWLTSGNEAQNSNSLWEANPDEFLPTLGLGIIQMCKNGQSSAVPELEDGDAQNLQTGIPGFENGYFSWRSPAQKDEDDEDNGFMESLMAILGEKAGLVALESSPFQWTSGGLNLPPEWIAEEIT